MKSVLRTLAYLFGFSTAVNILAAAGILGRGEDSLWIPVAVQALATVALWRWSMASERRREHGQDHVDQLASEAQTFIDAINREGHFPPTKTERVVSRQDNPVLAACRAHLIELERDTSRAMLGTKINVGSLPIYLGKSFASRADVARVAAAGELAITPRELVFSSEARTLPTFRLVA